MGVTYTSATERDRQRTRPRAKHFRHADLLLVLSSGVSILAIALACAGRLTLFALSESTRREPVVNLNTVDDARRLEPAVGVVFANLHDRSFAAQELFRFLVEERNEGRVLPNVGAIARATASASSIDRSKGLEDFSRRLQLTRDNAASAGRMPAQSVPVLTSSELATLKPLLTVRTLTAFRREVLLFVLLYVAAFHLAALVWRLRGVQGDLLLLSVAHLLTGIGFALLLSRPDPLRDGLLFVRFAEATSIGVLGMTGISLIDFGRVGFLELSYLPLIGALFLSALLVLFGSGPGSSAAKINLGPFQPIEGIRLLLALFLAGYFARRWELLRGLRSTVIRGRRLPDWLNLPRAEYVLPVLIGVGTALLLLFVQKDLGPALFLCCVFLPLYAVARGRIGMAVAGFALLFAGFYVGFHLHVSPTLTARVRLWESPWDNAVAGGDQIAHAIWAMATGGPFGTGLGLGDSRYIPAGHTDLVLAATGEELGAAGIVLVAVCYVILAWRGLRIARRAGTDYGLFLATALTLFLIVPVLIMASGILGVTPLTGIVTPFLSYGGSAMVANFAALGVLAAIDAAHEPSTGFEAFRLPMKWLAGILGAFAVALAAIVVNVTILRADDYVVRPHLGIQADGGRRFEYNPRVLDMLRLLPRGTIYDREGVPLASDDVNVIDRARKTYERLGVRLADACPHAGERCYPLGGLAFHLLGDARTQANWTASNTSYVERDAEDTLRGFNDHATAVQTLDATGRPMSTIRRDYREILPVLRHRYKPTDAVGAGPRQSSRDVHLTIDANLQLRVSSIVASYARAAAGKAAAVVLDPDTGELLASVSVPWPAYPGDRSASVPAETLRDPFLDRARYGLYPPGSTFKLVTAAAALRSDKALARATFICARLSDGRVGAQIKGWSRPVRDDILDTRPHGTIDMREGFVHSCNAYFAQLAVTLGPQPLVEAAGRLGISLTPSTDARRVRATLPQLGYGQADVVVTPLRMVRVAAAVASNGTLRDPCWEQTATSPSGTDQFLDTDAARLLQGYMRDVVVAGTGRTLRNHPWRIAGKTGTAELSGRPSHSWFVGFAPYGPATRRIAFVVLIENAGYGGRTAAAAAGEIVSAAADAGLLK